MKIIMKITIIININKLNNKLQIKYSIFYFIKCNYIIYSQKFYQLTIKRINNK